MDGDGDTDVLSASAGDGKIAWYENTTPPPGIIPTISECGLIGMGVVMLALGCRRRGSSKQRQAP